MSLSHYDINQDTHLTARQKYDKIFMIKADRAIFDEQQKQDRFWRRSNEYDERQRQATGNREGLSDFERENRILLYCGDYPYCRYWYQVPAWDVDNTVGLPFWFLVRRPRYRRRLV